MHGSQANVCRIRPRPCHPLEALAIIVNVAPFGVDYWCAVLIHGGLVPVGRLRQPWSTREEHGSDTDVGPNKQEERRRRFFHRGMDKRSAVFTVHGCCLQEIFLTLGTSRADFSDRAQPLRLIGAGDPAPTQPALLRLSATISQDFMNPTSLVGVLNRLRRESVQFEAGRSLSASPQ